MQARYYDPLIGRFYSNDPVGFTASNPMMFNRYAYANNNPYKYIDPNGLAGILVLPPPPVVAGGAASHHATQSVPRGGSSGDRVSRGATGVASSSQTQNNDKITLYRGVDKGSDSYGAARVRLAIPRGGSTGHTNANAHSEGQTEDSAYTSWSTSKDVAKDFATNDVGSGVILTKEVGMQEITLPSQPADTSEHEVLLKGTVHADKVEKVE